MKTALRTLAVVLALAAVIVWLATGANRGWTKNQVEVKTLDEVTGIEQRTWQDKFLPGVDFLGAGLLIAAGLAGGSLFFRKPKQTIT